ncbi:MAG TPA: type II toxin-antitoxin system VapC family toxin [Vicinamibacterales bacterium]|nr:type II toxin-antitoxin system VapC family toxin [Vicinamibacterales bacterium]
MKFLVDASVLSEPTKPAPYLPAVDWLRRHESELAIDPIVLGELRFGILLRSKGKRRERLERWFDAGVQSVQCLAWDAATGLRWARLMAALRVSGRAMPIKDSLVAATALVYDLTVVTRNRADFEKAGVRVFDPFTDA